MAKESEGSYEMVKIERFSKREKKGEEEWTEKKTDKER